jgi:epoxyqueuosine reductase
MLEHSNMDKNFRAEIENFAKTLGFDLIGFSPAQLDKKYFNAYEKWLKEGNHANMSYMEKSAQRKNLTKILKKARTVIVLGVNYFHPQKNDNKNENFGIIARYAYGRDYHKIIGKKLKQLEDFIKKLFPNDFTKSYVDTGPILERAFAETCQIGHIGKNGCIITKTFGSWIFLSEIITTVDLCRNGNIEVEGKGRCTRATARCAFEPIKHRLKFADSYMLESANCTTCCERASSLYSTQNFSPCGTCTRCIDSCPTKAIIAPGIIDARKCIAYHTIENKNRIPAKIANAIKKTKRIFGCDICQEVCPHNIAKQKITPHPEFLKPLAGDKISLKKLLAIKSDKEFLNLFAGSPLMRAKLKKLKSTANFLLSKIAAPD